MKHYLHVILVLICAACSQMQSSDIRSAGIYAAHTISANGGVVTCQTTLRAGGGNGTFINLDGSDSLTCNGIPMHRESDAFGQVFYRATVEGHPRSTYEIKLTRDNETLSAAATLPSAVTGSEIVGGATHQIGSIVAVTWDRSAFYDEQTTANLYMNDDHKSRFGGATVQDSSPESGSATFRGEDTQIRYYDEKTGSYQKASGPYSAKIEVRRSKTGALNGAWQGSIEASQSQSLSAKFVD